MRFSFGAPIDFDAPLCTRFTHSRAQALPRHRMKSGRIPPCQESKWGWAGARLNLCATHRGGVKTTTRRFQEASQASALIGRLPYWWSSRLSELSRTKGERGVQSDIRRGDDCGKQRAYRCASGAAASGPEGSAAARQCLLGAALCTGRSSKETPRRQPCTSLAIPVRVCACLIRMLLARLRSTRSLCRASLKP